MFLLGEAGSVSLVVICAVIAIILFVFLSVLLFRYAYLVYSEKNYKAERYVAYSGYVAIAVMIISFIIFCVVYNADLYNEVEDFNYYGLFGILGIIAYAPLLIISDIKQINFITNLSDSERKAKGIGLKDRRPFIYVVLFVLAINLALLGLNLEFLIIYLF